ncbi:MAG: hypothetical protein A3H06_00735 [Candidatus Colwellbacteria bacterium RIFCSPLOWO2_12_FULL_44_13]|uniref:histidine kinase n=3 Tax=Candidatus Colwelliibacteriota TaxID=1817904 RepID=A0A1G1Z9S8_9BACT|nr:MAG: hypothetical protein A3F24_00910 [Candidatus Colwellbacteria bacterium RIFCSPHIGHO2_12_FULL_44_17]OGY60836.1 MAG: hypothetical protein A3I31_01510 [Candidatus Colwellbacteria bacterium RIFCSPLOWO2_02_FULL_44_20b]OGY61382.1 MAG: hypothetical protein A3H06_00735 [Candidatus Colwellbacteria bacterium RIFCSPLOWO2_12_FULL_44_13]
MSGDFFKDFLKRLRETLRIREFRLLWVLLLAILILLVVDLLYFKAPGGLIRFGVFVVLAIAVLLSNFRLAVSNFEVWVERSRLKSIILNLKDGIVAYDENFKILVFNQAAEKIFKVSQSEVLGVYFSPEQAQDPRLRLMTQSIFPSLAPVAIRRSEPGAYPQVLDISFAESGLELRISTDRIVDQKGRVLGFVKLITDRTRESEFRRSKSEFITVAAHQLRSPLTSVNWALQTLKDSRTLTSEDRELVSGSFDASVKVLKIVNDLLDVAMIEEGRFGYTFQQTNIIEFLEGVLHEAQPIAQEYQTHLYFKKPEGVLPLLHIDPKRLGIVVSNLLDNAMKYNVQNGEVVVGVTRFMDRPYVQVSVSDTGVGVSEEAAQKLFQKFFRAENVIKFRPEGSGLGLYIAKNIIARHGGEIWAQSTLNRGSTFYFTLPTDPRLIPPKEIGYGDY